MRVALLDGLDDKWLELLAQGHRADSPLLEDLRHFLVATLRKVLHKRQDYSQDDLEDFAQETLLRLIEKYPTFKGESAFSTWAAAIATRVAFTELRNRHKKGELLSKVKESAAAGEDWRIRNEAKDDEGRDLVEALYAGIRERLTEKQRALILAELRGVPTIQIAVDMNTNQNALYKLGHDARKKLKEHLIAAGFTPEALHHVHSPEGTD